MPVSRPLFVFSPYAGCAIGEYYNEQHRDVLVVYDDLSKQASAYRSCHVVKASLGEKHIQGISFICIHVYWKDQHA